MVDKVVPVDPEFFAGLVAASGAMARELSFTFGPDGASCLAKDPSGSALLEWSVGPEYFKALPAAPVEVEVLEDFAAALRGAKKGCGLSVDVSEAVVAVVLERGESRVRRCVSRRDFGRPLGPDPRTRMDAIEAGTSVLCTVGGAAFLDALKEFKPFSEGSFVIQAVPEAVLLSVEGDAGAGVDVRLDVGGKGMGVGGSGRSKFGVSLVALAAEFLGAGAGFALVTLKYSPKASSPLFISGEFPGVRVRAAVAPVEDR